MKGAVWVLVTLWCVQMMQFYVDWGLVGALFCAYAVYLWISVTFQTWRIGK